MTVLFGSVVVAWLISAMGVAGRTNENKNIQDEFILATVYLGIYRMY